MSRKDKLYPYLLIAPSVLIIFLVLLLPLVYSVYCSLYKVDYMNFTEFVGLGNYIRAFSNKAYMAALGRTFLISGISLVISLLLGISFSLWIHKHKGAFAFIIQMVVLVPWVTSQVVAALLWKWILAEDLGIFNYLVTLLGGEKLKILSSPTVALWALILVMSWRTIGYAMVNILAGLKGISPDIEEAASIDGASRWQLFSRIRLPMLKTPILLSTIILTLSNINNLTIPLTLTGGGPGTATSVITIPIYQLGFGSYQFGISSALSVILFLITVVLSMVYVKAVRYEV